jgi:hypothetical protein
VSIGITEASSCSICSEVFCSWKLFFECGVLLLAYQVNDYTLTGIINKVNDLPQYISLIAARIITAAIIQWQSILSSLVAFGHDRTYTSFGLMHADLLMVQVYC